MREPHKRRSGYGPRVLFAKLGESKNQDHRSTQVQSLPKKGGDITETQVWPRVKHLGQKRELETMPKTTQYPKKEPRNLRKKWKKMEEIEERQKHSDPNSQFLQFPYDHKECRKTKGGSLRRRRRRRRRRRLRQERKSRFFPFSSHLFSSLHPPSSSLLPPPSTIRHCFFIRLSSLRFLFHIIWTLSFDFPVSSPSILSLLSQKGIPFTYTSPSCLPPSLLLFLLFLLPPPLLCPLLFFLSPFHFFFFFFFFLN